MCRGSGVRVARWVGAFVFLVVCMVGGSAPALRFTLPNLLCRVPVAPMPVMSEGKVSLAYELWISSIEQSSALRIDTIEVFAESGGSALLTLSGAKVDEMARYDSADATTGEAGATTRRTLPPGGSMMLMLWVETPQDGPLPEGLTHKITYSSLETTGTVKEEMVVEGVPVAVHPRTAPVLGPPVRDGVWIMFNGPDSRHHHWRAVFGDQGVPRIGQRFAADWLKLNADGVFFTGTGKRNEDYPCFGEDLVAMADGVVVLARDGLEDINPGEAPHTEDWQTANDIGGNHVLLSIGGGLYIFYAHMQKGSIVVREGEVVRRGDVLGKLGNSGNSDAPHLHLHVMSGQRALHDVGLPYRLAAYEHLGWWNTFEEDIPAGQGYDIAGATAVRYTEDLPRANAIIRILDEAGATITIGEDAAFTSSTGRLVARNVSTGDGYVTMELTWSAGAGAFVLDNMVATPEAYPRDGAAWDATAGTLRLPRVRVGTQVYAVTLRRTETGGMAFALESATPWP